MDVQAELLKLQDKKYGQFQQKLLPAVAADSIIGVRTPALRQMAKALLKSDGAAAFLTALPHKFFEENQLQAFMIAGIKDYDLCLRGLKAFLPYVDNWATCDQMSPQVFKKHRGALLPEIKIWLQSSHTYTKRFAIKMLMDHFLDEDFDLSYLELVAAVRSEEYYVNMMIAWYFATALAKQYEAALPFIEKKRLAVWTHNKAIQKARESYRVSAAAKAYLQQLKIKQR
ncbi:MAG: DNA alkylation repair protein [Selenomonas sp.]|nr:DNA alkylation repair protein [Selenomonas sp.]